MNFISKSITIFLLLAILPACEKYMVGVIRPAIYSKVGIVNFNYVIINDRTFLEGKINDEYFSGELFTVNNIRKYEKLKNPSISMSEIRAKNIFAFARMTSKGGRQLDCFIKQASNYRFNKGGNGRCYILDTAEQFDIYILGK